MALQTVLSAVNANTASAAFDVSGPFTVSTVGLRQGETVEIQIADTDTEARYNRCGYEGALIDNVARTFTVYGAWKARAVPRGLKSDSSVTVLFNQ